VPSPVAQGRGVAEWKNVTSVSLRPVQLYEQEGRPLLATRSGLPAAEGGSVSRAAALDPDPPLVTPAPDTPRGFSG